MAAPHYVESPQRSAWQVIRAPVLKGALQGNLPRFFWSRQNRKKHFAIALVRNNERDATDFEEKMQTRNVIVLVSERAAAARRRRGQER